IVESAKGIDVGRVVSRIESPLKTALLKQASDRRAFVSVDRREKLEDLPAESRNEAGLARSLGDGLELAARLSLVARAAVVQRCRERFVLDLGPLDSCEQPA